MNKCLGIRDSECDSEYKYECGQFYWDSLSMLDNPVCKIGVKFVHFWFIPNTQS